MLGVTISGSSKAHSVRAVLAAKVIQDRLAGDSVLLLVGPDRASIRVFQERLSGLLVTFLVIKDAGQF
jgi:hypothetical protein